MTRQPSARTAEPRTDPLIDALAYALARVDLPMDTDTSRDYATQLVPVMRQSGYIEAEAAVPAGLDVEALREALWDAGATEWVDGDGIDETNFDGTVDALADRLYTRLLQGTAR